MTVSIHILQPECTRMNTNILNFYADQMFQILNLFGASKDTIFVAYN